MNTETETACEPSADRLVYSVAEASALLGISRAFAYELVARGELPVMRLGRRRLVPKVALHALFETDRPRHPRHCDVSSSGLVLPRSRRFCETSTHISPIPLDHSCGQRLERPELLGDHERGVIGEHHAARDQPAGWYCGRSERRAQAGSRELCHPK